MKEKIGLVCDRMLIRLARWLRMAGYDVITPDTGSDKEMYDITRNTDRILLTRDRELSERKGITSIRIFSDDPDKQLQEFIGSVGKDIRRGNTRCSTCNGELIYKEKELLSEEESSAIPGKVLDNIEIYFICKVCKKAYWIGGHWPGISERLSKVGLEPDIPHQP